VWIKKEKRAIKKIKVYLNHSMQKSYSDIFSLFFKMAEARHPSAMGSSISRPANNYSDDSNASQ